jgi:hypothetical protein
MNRKEDMQQVFKRNRRRVEADLNCFGVTGRSRTNVVVCGIGPSASGITGDHALDAAQVFENCVKAPETTSGQRSYFSGMM